LALRARTRDGASRFAITWGEGGDEAVVVSGTLVMNASEPASSP
jgi:hypothetical protein